MTHDGSPGPAAVSGRRNLTLILSGQAVSLLGDYVALLALPLFVVELTGSALDLGLTMAFETVPTLLFGFAAGVALDRMSLRRALVIADLGRAAAFAALAVAVAAGAAEVWMVFLVAFVVGTMTVGFDSGFQAWLPSLVGENVLLGVNSRLQFIRTAAWTVGPPVAGFLATGFGGFGAAFLLDAGTFLISAMVILALREVRPRERIAHLRWLPAFREGMRALWRDGRLRSATLAATAVNMLFAAMEALLVLFARDRLGIDEGALIGWFFAGHALLGAVGVVGAPWLARRLGLGRSFVLGLGMLGAGFFALNAAAPAVASLTPIWSTVVSVIPAGISVAGVSITNVSFFTLRQQLPPPEMLGRVIAASRTLAWAGLPLGPLLGGALAEQTSLGLVYGAASGLLLAVAASLVATALWRVPVAAPAAERAEQP
jgi:MFS family permease